MQSASALFGSATPTDVTINAQVNYIAGSDEENGTGTFEAKGDLESKSALFLPGGARSWVQQSFQGEWSSPAKQRQPAAHHNCLNTASWFFPHFLIQSALSDATRTVRYIAAEELNGAAVQHVQISGIANDPNPLDQQLSVNDLYLDAKTFLPVALSFSAHPDTNALVNIPVQVQFSNYQTVGGVRVPFHVQKYLQGSLFLDLAASQAVLNSGLPDSDFSIQ